MMSQNPIDRIIAKKPINRKRILQLPMFNPKQNSCFSISEGAVDHLSYGLALAYYG
jgi:hypothetical protein